MTISPNVVLVLLMLIVLLLYLILTQIAILVKFVVVKIKEYFNGRK
jgi:hypothetical protein